MAAQREDAGISQLVQKGLLQDQGDEGFCHRGRLYVPPALRTEVLANQHCSRAAGHPGIKKTQSNVKRHYWWPGWSSSCEDFVRGCVDCQRTKHSRKAPAGLLRPLPIPDRAWVDISLDHLTGLGTSEVFDAVLVVVDRFSKMAVFIPAHKDDQAPDFAQQFMRWVYPRFGLPETVVSDRGPLFVSSFWSALTQKLGVSRKLSSAAHPETDRQTEIVNQWLGQYLRVFSNYEQDDWAALLPQAEFAYNSTTHSSMGMSPFEAYCGRQPRRSYLEPPRQVSEKDDPEAAAWYEEMRGVHSRIKDAIAKAQESQRRFYNRGRRDPQFAKGDKVWLAALNIRKLRDNEKLDYKQLGPYEVIEKVGSNAYRLRLPPYLKVFNVFHVSLLQRFEADKFPGRPPPATRPAHPTEDEEYEVEEIRHRKRRRNPASGKQEWMWEVKWVGYPEEANSWEPKDHLEHLPMFWEFEEGRTGRPYMAKGSAREALAGSR